MSQSKILVFLSSVRPGRMADRVCKLVEQTLKDNGMLPIVFDPQEMPFELLKTPLHFMRDPETEAPDWLKEANETIKNADGFLILSAEYNCGIPPALCNMMDHFPPTSYRHRPCGFVNYSMGSFGGTRVNVILRPFASELGMITVPTYAIIPQVHETLDEEGKSSSERVSGNLTKLVKELGWYARALKSHKESESPPS